MATIRQVNFEAGEIADKLHSRGELEVYKRGLKTCRNFFPTLEGQLVSRPGSMFVRETKYSGAITGRVRLVPFVFGNGQAYVLEFGHNYVRFHANGGTIESSPGVPYEIASPYGWSSLPSLQFAQVGNVMVLTQPGFDAYVLERLTHTSWTLTTQSYTPPAWPGLPYLEPRLDPVTFKGFSGYMSEPMLETSADFIGTATRPVREWIWAVTLEGQNKKTGKRFESLPFIVQKKYDGSDTYPALNGTVLTLADHLVACYPDKPVIISAYRLTIGTAPDFLILGLNFYRGRGDLYGFVGRTLHKKFYDVGDAPDFAYQPPLGTHPFKVFAENGAVQRIEKPMAVAFAGDRLVFGGAWDNDKLIRVGTLFFSEQGQWDRFDRYKVPYATMALEFELATTTRQEIRTLLTHHKLLIGTDSQIHSIWGSQGTPLDATAIPDRRVEAHIGCSHLRMLSVRGTVIFAEGAAADGYGSDQMSYGIAVHALRFTDGAGEYKNRSLSNHASHLFYGDGGGITRWLVDWAFAARPWQLVWAVRRDGVLLSCTFDPESGMAGWARHDTDGAYENVCTVPEGAEDAVYVCVKRTINGVEKRYIERMTSRARLGGSTLGIFGPSSPADDVCLDSAKYYYGVATTTLTGLSHLEGKSVYLVREGYPPAGPYVVAGGQLTVPAGVVKANVLTYVGLLYTPEMETLPVGGEPEKQKTLKGIVLHVKDTRGCHVGYTLEKASAMKPVKQLRPSIGYDPIPNESRKLVIPTTGTWDSEATAALRQTQPLPCTITGLTRIIEVGGGL